MDFVADLCLLTLVNQLAYMLQIALHLFCNHKFVNQLAQQWIFLQIELHRHGGGFPVSFSLFPPKNH